VILLFQVVAGHSNPLSKISELITAIVPDITAVEDRNPSIAITRNCALGVDRNRWRHAA